MVSIIFMLVINHRLNEGINLAKTMVIATASNSPRATQIEAAIKLIKNRIIPRVINENAEPPRFPPIGM